MTKDEALRLALEALECAIGYTSCPSWSPSMTDECAEAITAIKATLEAKDEPVGTAGELFSNTALERLDLRPSTGIYITPPQRKPLTDEEIWKFWWNKPEVPEGEDDSMEAQFVAACRRAIEAAHGIKGEA